MNDIRMPDEIVDWMTGLNWGQHHDQWHFERRWDFWHHLAANGPTPEVRAQIQAMVDYAISQGWQRAELQEGQAGNGLEFLMMHRAMLQLIIENFSQHQQLVAGWSSPPTNPEDEDDPVPDGTPFDPVKLQGVAIIQGDLGPFTDEDSYGLFIETNIQAIPSDPTHRDPDQRKGVHNYLHSRWTDQASPINLGDPKVNLFNRRFWKLHGWIDNQWSRFRQARGLLDTDPAYVATLAHHKHMMGGHMHPMSAALTKRKATVDRPRAFGRFFWF